MNAPIKEDFYKLSPMAQLIFWLLCLRNGCATREQIMGDAQDWVEKHGDPTAECVDAWRLKNDEAIRSGVAGVKEMRIAMN